ncbi:MAG TPA: hypothetical protein H9836_19510, partial [Candidatus Nocardiopsis merdipullorum]|nr:hypothetical protein [Candidatus Nocardiopsis merdipullorum]
MIHFEQVRATELESTESMRSTRGQPEGLVDNTHRRRSVTSARDQDSLFQEIPCLHQIGRPENRHENTVHIPFQRRKTESGKWGEKLCQIKNDTVPVHDLSSGEGKRTIGPQAAWPSQYAEPLIPGPFHRLFGVADH